MKQTTKGTLFILASALFFASYGIWSRLMGHAFAKFTQAWTRGLFLLIIVSLFSKKHHLFKPIPRQDKIWFLLIALAGGLNQAPYYFGFQNLSLGTATLLFYTALVAGGYLIGKLIFNEKLTSSKLASLTLSFLGLSLIYNLSLSPHQILPASLTILAGLMGACSAVLPKKLSHRYHEFQIMIGYFSIMFLANLSLAFFAHETIPPVSSTAWLAQLGYSISMLLANFFVIEGFKYLEPSIGSLIGLAEIIFGVLFGAFLFQESLPLATFIGGTIIIFAAALPHLHLKPPRA